MSRPNDQPRVTLIDPVRPGKGARMNIRGSNSWWAEHGFPHSRLRVSVSLLVPPTGAVQIAIKRDKHGHARLRQETGTTIGFAVAQHALIGRCRVTEATYWQPSPGGVTLFMPDDWPLGVERQACEIEMGLGRDNGVAAAGAHPGLHARYFLDSPRAKRDAEGGGSAPSW